MTIVVFDGETLVTDGMEVYPNSNFPEYMNRDSVVKIVILPKPWKYLENSVVTAIAGSGSVEDIEMVKGEIVRAINLGERASDFSRRFEVSFKDKFNCNIFGVGFSTNQNGDRSPLPFRVYTHPNKRAKPSLNPWKNGRNDLFSVGGCINTIPSELDLRDVFKNGVELASWVSCSNPKMVGGMLTRYNPITGKLDHPKHTSAKTLLNINKKMVGLEIERVNRKYSYFENDIKKQLSLGE